MTAHPYVGRELDLFARANGWKRYLRRQMRPFLGRRVLEVGAGIGATTRVLCSDVVADWICLEPDRALAARLQADIDAGRLPGACRVVAGTLEDLPPEMAGQVDTVLYIDVLEHIPDDRAEFERAAPFLSPSGFVIALSPAHQFLFTAFDASIGHCRRYTRRSLADAAPPSLELVKLRYLDSTGFFASLANRLFMNQSMPTASQIAFWDSVLVPASRVLDPLLFYRVGKSVLGVWALTRP